MRNVFAIVLILWAVAAPAQSSFHSLLSDPAPDAVEFLTERRNPGCVAILRKHLRAGHRFESRALDQFVIPLSKFQNPRTRSGNFYHYTDAQEMFSVAQDSNFESVFAHIRGEVRDDRSTYHQVHFYVATDDRSSASYGNIRVRVNIDPETLVLMTAGDSPLRPGSAMMAKKRIEDDLVRRYPDLEACRKHEIPGWDNGVLVLLAAETRGVGLIAYFGIDNAFGAQFNVARGTQWFQVLGPSAIRKMEASRVSPRR